MKLTAMLFAGVLALMFAAGGHAQDVGIWDSNGAGGARGEAEPNRVPFTARLVERALFVRRVLSGVA